VAPGASADAFRAPSPTRPASGWARPWCPTTSPAQRLAGRGRAEGFQPDGYTLAQIHTGVVRAQLMAERPAYDAQTDFTYIIQLSGSAHGIVVRADSPWKTLEELVAPRRPAPAS